MTDTWNPDPLPPAPASPAPAAPTAVLPPESTWAAASSTSEPAAAPATPAEPQKSRKAVAFALAAGLLVGAAGTGAVLVATDSGSAAPTTNLSQTASTPTSHTTRAQGTVAAVAAQVLPSVVSIKGQGGEGSGIVLDTQGHILTNNHVAVLGENGGSLTVVLQDGRTGTATIVGTDPSTDLAVIKVDGLDGLKPITLGTSSDLAVGDQVLAIGSPLGLSGTVTEGIVSSLNRPVTAGEDGTAVFDAVQTDAAINPGNSGGALVDMSGHLIGVNSAIASLGAAQGTQGGSIGLGFAIPVDQATRIAQELIKTGTATHARLGTTVGDQQNGTGAVLGEVADGSAAQQAGLQSGDVISKFDGRVIDGSEGLVAAIRSEAPGTKVQLTYERNGQEHTATVTLGSDADQS